MHFEVLKPAGKRSLRVGLVLGLVGVLVGVLASMFPNSLVLLLGLLLLAVGLLFLGVWSGMNYADKTVYESQQAKKPD